jgi:NAD-dependent protein deacetylase/lipoamidase
MDAIATAAEWIAGSRHVVVFTGAGISTDSGLPDFRGPDGVWTRRDAGLPPPAMKVPMSAVRPNIAHAALVELERMGRVQFLISQNVDGLHLASGFPSGKLAELHGNGELMRCLGCDVTCTLAEAGWDRARFGNGYRTDPVRRDQPSCRACGGRIISSVVNFDDPMPEKELALAMAYSRQAGVFFAIGSSLVVSPANEMPRIALAAGAKLILLNRGETPFDRSAHLRIHDGIGDVLPAIVARLRDKIA